MDKDQVKGRVDQAKGKIKEEAGEASLNKAHAENEEGPAKPGLLSIGPAVSVLRLGALLEELFVLRRALQRRR
jgi:hypothetical protein